MCGVFAFISRDDSPINLKILARVARATESRGPHAWGMAWIDGKGCLKMYKQAGRVTDALGLLKMARDARILIGHCRYATHGAPEDNSNNHPHACDGGWFVHNGVIRNYESVLIRFNLWPVSRCDSEVLGLLAEQTEGSYLKRCTEAVRSVQQSPLVMLGLWKPGTLIAIRQGNPLHMGTTPKGMYLGSLIEGLPGKAAECPDNEAVEFGEDASHVQF